MNWTRLSANNVGGREIDPSDEASSREIPSVGSYCEQSHRRQFEPPLDLMIYGMDHAWTDTMSV